MRLVTFFLGICLNLLQLNAENVSIREVEIGFKRIILLGCTGVGKSSLGNYLTNSTSFRVGSKQAAQTSECELNKKPPRGSKRQKPQYLQTDIEVVDTPGFNDRLGRDSKFWNDISTFLRENDHHAIIVVINGRLNRITGTDSMLLATAASAVQSVDPNSRLRLGIVFTMIQFDKMSERIRMDNLKDDENYSSDLNSVQIMKKQVVGELSKFVYRADLMLNQIFFLDIKNEMYRNEDVEGYSRSEFQWKAFYGWLETLPHTPTRFLTEPDATLESIEAIQTNKNNKLGEYIEEANKKQLQRIMSFLHEQARVSFFSTDSFVVYLASAMYSPKMSMLDENPLLTRLLKISSKEASVAVLHSGDKNTVYVVFKGSIVNKIEDWINILNSDLDEVLVGNKKLYLHGEFNRALSNRVSDWYQRIYNALAEHCTKNTCKKLIYAGHSLGGALALVCRAHHLNQKISWVLEVETVTFGAPLVFSNRSAPDLLQQLSNNSRNYVAGQDIVPRFLRFGYSNDNFEDVVRLATQCSKIMYSYSPGAVEAAGTITAFSAIAYAAGLGAATGGGAVLAAGAVALALKIFSTFFLNNNVEDWVQKLVERYLLSAEQNGFVEVGTTIHMLSVNNTLDSVPGKGQGDYCHSIIKSHEAETYATILKYLQGLPLGTQNIELFPNFDSHGIEEEL